MKLYFTRHGRTQWNEEHRFQGQTDIELNALGREQAELISENLKNTNISAIFASPLTRAMDTAREIAKHHDIEVVSDKRLIERGYGNFEGKNYETITPYDPDEFWSFDFDKENIERMDSVYDRIENFLDEIIDNYQDKDVLVVAHGGIYRPISCFFDGFPESGSLEHRRIHNCELKEYTIHSMNLQEKYFDFIKNGTKRIELRLNDEKRQKIKVNDTIRFRKNDKSEAMTAKVIGLHHYQTFEDMFKDFDAELFADKSISKDEMLKTMEEFYPIEKQKKIGVVGIEIEPISYRPEN